MYTRLSPEIKAFILDMDGVIWKSDHPIGNIEKIFTTLKDRGLRYAFATNNSTLDTHMYVDKLARFNVDSEIRLIVNSSIAIARKIRSQFPTGGGLYIIGEKGLIATLADYGFYHDEVNPLAVIAGMDRQLTYDKLARATFFIRQGKPFFGTNPDLTYPTPEGLAPGAGSVLAAIEAASGVKPILGGKPDPAIIHILLEELQLAPSQVLVVGDRLDTDIVSGHHAGCKTALVLTGVSTLEDLDNFTLKPDLVADNLENIVFGQNSRA